MWILDLCRGLNGTKHLRTGVPVIIRCEMRSIHKSQNPIPKRSPLSGCDLYLLYSRTTLFLFITMKLLALTLAALLSVSSGFVLPQTSPSFVSSTTALGSRKPFISGNWKLNPQTKAEAVQLATDIAASITSSSPDAEVALFVPYVFIEAAQEAVGGKVEIGAEVSSCVLTSLWCVHRVL